MNWLVSTLTSTATSWVRKEEWDTSKIENIWDLRDG